MSKARSALDDAFQPPPKDDAVLFQLPVTKRWLEQVVLSALLRCHGSYRGVQGFLQDVFDMEVSIGTIHDIVMAAVEKARRVHAQEDLSPIHVGAHDEIFQGDPILVGVDPVSTYCYLLAQEPSRDGTTWAVHWLDLAGRGLTLDYTVADAGKGLRAGQAEAWPEVPCRGDVFHAQREMTKMATYLENRAYGCIGTREEVERRMERDKAKGKGQSFSKKLAIARKEETAAVELADDLHILAQWMREDVLSLTGPDVQGRRELFDFIVAEMRAREALAPHRIRPVRVALENQRGDLLAFAQDIDWQLAQVAPRHKVALEDVREVFEMGHFAAVDPQRWQADSELWKRLGALYPEIRKAVAQVAENTVRASSMVENLNSRLRCYFFLRHQVGPAYLELLRFFLNHRRYPRSRKDPRTGRSPAEILHGEAFPHWLAQLGYTCFRRAA
ncbi:MAG: hypothetical protein HY722_04045 [Planctomycetes bacterium]|nr:hypothetical protein [Planctomycetota bacterium]